MHNNLSFLKRGPSQKQLASIFVLLMAILLPLLMVVQVKAAGQLTVRHLSISSAIPGQTSVSYTFGFSIATAGQVQSMKFQACTTAVGTCSAPTGYTVASRTFTTQTGWSGATNFALSTS